LELPLEISGAIMTLQYWFSDIDFAGFVTIFLVAISLINIFGVKFYGDFQVFFSVIKIAAVIIFIAIGIIINVGGGPDKKYYGSETWRKPGAFFNGFHGYCGILEIAAYAFSGIDVIGQTANESANPRKFIPRATNQVSITVVMFYIVSLLVVGFIVPYTDRNLASEEGINASPFVIACKIAGIDGFANFMNFIILVSTFSGANSTVYGGCRTLLGLVKQKQAFKWLGYVDRFNRPLLGIAFSLAFGLIAYGNTDMKQAEVCFLWMVAISGSSAIFTWASICAAHISFRKAWVSKGHTLEELPYQAPFGLWGSVIGLFGWLLVLIAIFYGNSIIIHN
jgi:amino acid transporter